MINIDMKVLKLFSEAKVPIRSTSEAAGFDLFAREATQVPGSVSEGGRVTIGRALIPTGIAIAIPVGCVGRIGSRSGLSVRHNLEVGAGWIDPDYRGEVMVELKNLGAEPFQVEQGARMAQLFVLNGANINIEIVDTLPKTERSDSGFGSTGTF
ncbi:MAG: dUTP diphosphatase [Nitrospiraceae bacterium]|nr:dUTP diphosphatase [Nitrospiraceae bacterium]